MDLAQSWYQHLFLEIQSHVDSSISSTPSTNDSGMCPQIQSQKPHMEMVWGCMWSHCWACMNAICPQDRLEISWHTHWSAAVPQHLLHCKLFTCGENHNINIDLIAFFQCCNARSALDYLDAYYCIRTREGSIQNSGIGPILLSKFQVWTLKKNYSGLIGYLSPNTQLNWATFCKQGHYWRYLFDIVNDRCSKLQYRYSTWKSCTKPFLVYTQQHIDKL